MTILTSLDVKSQYNINISAAVDSIPIKLEGDPLTLDIAKQSKYMCICM